ncbi:YafY family transcriptional regulator [Tropicibacter sp. R16_0]|uniref:helix-turn-helix transcriptional regulator n=1 Tax=Tropicibacter sp. R16_0 TaxID=2821102 RepID=UPI001AD9D15E|nr:YafY family protein [Tropicibacter sp. R16_0]MBO9449847.1 YafY family transcriptional regulator [Tropicibacter sp. R16_0]
MRRGDRLFELIEILRRAKGPISAQSIGEELGVTKRTVYRDVAALIGQGVPINGEAGVGYVLEPGFHMPPLMLTPDEIEAVTLGMLWVQTRGEPELALAAEKLITKLEAVAPDKYRTSFLQPTVSVAPVDQPEEVLGSAAIRLAIRRRKKISLTYSDNSGQRTLRLIWPILLGYRDTSRIIAAWCEMREGFRYFRTERIIEAEVLDDSIPRRMDLLRAEWRLETDAERKRYEYGL